jgi:hypothetical protein
MNNNAIHSFPRDLDALQARFARRVAARLTEQAEGVSPDVSERLRFARETALARARAQHESASAPAVAPKRRGLPWWIRVASFAPLIMLLVGLGVIGELHDRSEIAAAAEIDVALLADNLPPDAYRDAGFVEFLRTAQE